jgi:hypothetical protein
MLWTKEKGQKAGVKSGVPECKAVLVLLVTPVLLLLNDMNII